MPELAEVAFYAKQWDASLGQRIVDVELHSKARVFRACDLAALEDSLPGARLKQSLTHGKQMLFSFSGGLWLGVHLGMSGRISVEPPSFAAGRHDHLLLRTTNSTLVFHDPRQFGAIQLYQSKALPQWWRDLAPLPKDTTFTVARLTSILHRHSRQPLKALLLDQRYFPGVGNWMADEVLWQGRLHPETSPAGLRTPQIAKFHRLLRKICQVALQTIGKDWSDPPKSWLFHYRWAPGHACPRCGTALERDDLRGRTACWCPSCQVLPQT